MFNDNGSLVTKWNEVPKRRGKKRETNMKYIVGKTNEKMESTIKKLKEDNARYQIIKEKTKAEDQREDFKEFYRRIKIDHVIPM